MTETMTQTYEMVCEHLGWMAQTKPIRITRRTNTTTYVTGTLLKPEEWRELMSHDGETIPDGTILRVTHAPTL